MKRGGETEKRRARRGSFQEKHKSRKQKTKSRNMKYGETMKRENIFKNDMKIKQETN